MTKPLTPEQQYNLRLLVLVWNNEGPVPWYHRHMKKWLLKKWPLLYSAVNNLAKERW